MGRASKIDALDDASFRQNAGDTMVHATRAGEFFATKLVDGELRAVLEVHDSRAKVLTF